jgi:membrane associated rhomboid family serine protease
MYPTLADCPATLCLLVATVAISLIAFSNRKLWGYLALVPFRMRARNEYHAIVTSGFLHGGMAHLFLNMVTLFFVGPSLEREVGSVQFLAIYAISLVVGNIFPLIKYRQRPDYVAIGASGAISGIVFSFCMIHPTEKVYAFFAIGMPAWLFALLYVGYSIYAMRNVDDNIGHEAHLGGALGGVIATLLISPGLITIFG